MWSFICGQIIKSTTKFVKESPNLPDFPHLFLAIVDATNRFGLINKEIEAFKSEVDRCRALKSQVTEDEVKFFDILMDQVETQYAELVVSNITFLYLPFLSADSEWAIAIHLEKVR